MSAMRRYAQLDGLRSVAVAGVLVQHGLGLVGAAAGNGGFALGSVGVRLFFVLSGFLITGILLRERLNASRNGGSVWTIWRAFYCRRALRILPLGYLAFGIAWVVGSPSAQAHPVHFLTYTSNYFVAREGLHDPSLDHYWSLAIEEQFYLIWPFVILLVPERLLWQSMALIVIGATLARSVILAHSGVHAAYVSTASRLDALAIGGLLAWMTARSPQGRHTGLLVTFFSAAAIARAISAIWPENPLIAALPETGYVLGSAAVVLAAAVGIPGPIGRFLSLRPVVAVGTISYGIYVYHMLIAGLVPVAERRFGLDLPFPTELGWLRLLSLVAVTVPVAALSWRFVERPLTELKHLFPYVRCRPTATRAEGSESPTSQPNAYRRIDGPLET